MSPKTTGKLYGIGVGPGDPDLVTVKAIKILKATSIIFAASSTKNDYSLAENIVRKHVPEASVQTLPFPMSSDLNVLRDAWERNARAVLRILDSGKDVAFVTLGDPMTYSTFSYLLRTAREMNPNTDVEIIPGITSYQAAASMANIPLVEGEESLVVLSGAKGSDKLLRTAKKADNIVVLKTYKSFDQIYDTLENLGLLDRATFFSKIGLPGEEMIRDVRTLKSVTTSYLSLIIINRNHEIRTEQRENNG
ncbi:MAG: precorrin-2 C(20)-methyltransferase [Deltaproteobacteria bacterium]|nr:precorrin-2 C(20)-methyltransferase [Deltaproteobacteria bacterium]